MTRRSFLLIVPINKASVIKMPVPASNFLCASLSFALGVFAFVKSQAITKDFFEPIIQQCTSKEYATVDDFVTQTSYRAYTPYVGLVVLDPFVCIITQFMYTLAESYPSGLLTCGTSVLTFMPAIVLIALESGRQGSKGPIRYPTCVLLLVQLLGPGIAVTALWVPSYCLGGNSKGAISSTWAKASFLMTLPFMITFLLVFVILEDTSSNLWTLCAGIFGGPLMALPMLPLFFVGPPPRKKGEDNDQVKTAKAGAVKSAEIAAVSYGLIGLVTLLGWFYLTWVALSLYGTDFDMLWKDIWADTSPVVQFMAINATFLWGSLVLHIASRSFKSMIEAVLFTFFFGPGAACAMTLASLELSYVQELHAEKAVIHKEKTT